ncbi:hypothetical protein LJC74_08500 [Eubacteriales bacterium OttesenSCG-928-A19]|nr:hypothetical protein [Eubacteriales bacterium OttesenSCG-928-A19]
MIISLCVTIGAFVVYVGLYLALERLMPDRSRVFYVLGAIALMLLVMFLYRWLLAALGLATPPRQLMSIGGLLLCVAVLIAGRRSFEDVYDLRSTDDAI